MESLIHGNDGLVRAVNVRANNRVTSYPIVRLYPLEVTLPPDDQLGHRDLPDGTVGASQSEHSDVPDETVSVEDDGGCRPSGQLLREQGLIYWYGQPG